MGALPNVYPGYQAVDDLQNAAKFGKAWNAKLSTKTGLTVTEMVNAAVTGEIKAMFILGENPMVSDPDIQHVKEALKSLDFLVVQDIFLSRNFSAGRCSASRSELCGKGWHFHQH